MNDCLFCKIIKKEIPSTIILETDFLVVFPDINPAAKAHLLIVPKEHIGGIQDLGIGKGQLLEEIYETANKLVTDNNLKDDLYRVVVNGGKAQHVPHLHFHLLGGNLKKLV